MELKSSFQLLAEYLLQKTDHADEKAVVLVYDFYKQVKNEDYSFQKLFKKQMTTEKVLKEINELSKLEKEQEIVEEHIEEMELEKDTVESKEKKIFIICCSILICMIGIVLYLEIYEPFQIMTKIPINMIIVLFAIAGAVTFFSSVILFTKYCKKRKVNDCKKLLQKTGEEKYREKEEERLIKQEYYGKTTCLKNERNDIHRLIGFRDKEIVEFRLHKNPFIIGKKKSLADGILTNPAVSRMHAKIYCENGHCYLMDLNSTNGTCQNGVRLNANESKELVYNDEVSFAGEIFYFR